MSRAAATVACLALLGVAMAPAPGWAPRVGRAEAAACVWHRHTKRVVRHVRRHGQHRTVSRRRHWWTCDGTPTPPIAPASPAPPAGEPETTSNRLGVRAVEFYFVLSRPGVEAGEVTIELDNRGEDAHDLNLQRQGGGEEPVLELGETQSLQRATARFDLAAGTYRLWCSLPEHREKGMETTLVVGG
jgi:plastocyanin